MSALDSQGLAKNFNKLTRELQSEHVRRFGHRAIETDREGVLPGSGRYRLYTARPFSTARTEASTARSVASTQFPQSGRSVIRGVGSASGRGTLRTAGGSAMGSSARSIGSRASSVSRQERLEQLKQTYTAERVAREEAEKRVRVLRREMEVLATGFSHFAQIPREEDKITTERREELQRLKQEQKKVDFEWERRRVLALAEQEKFAGK